MAVPTLSADQIEDIYVTTWNQKIPEVMDNVYGSNPLLGILNQQDKILLDGGRRIEQPFMYGKLNGGMYGRGDTFNTARVNTKTAFIGDWKLCYADLTIDGLDDLQNAGASAAFDNAELKMDEAQMTLEDTLGDRLVKGAGSGTDLDGLPLWIDDGTNYASVWGVTRGTDPVGTAAKATFNSTGGSFTIPFIQSNLYGPVTIAQAKPNLALMTETLWDALFNRVQPLQRYPSTPVSSGGAAGQRPTGHAQDLLAQIGFDSIRYQRAACVVDSHLPSGETYWLNLDYSKLIVHSLRPGVLRGWMPTSNKDERVNQLLWAGNFVCGGPRFNSHGTGLTA